MLEDHYLIAIDGTGTRSSHKVKCEKCCVKEHRNGSKTYHHQMLGAAMIHPDHSVVLPLAPEPIRKEDGAKKNDCERNAAERLLDDLRREHPRLKAIIVEDALASNGPDITHLKNKGFRFILGAKPVITSFCSAGLKPVNPRNHGSPETRKPAPYNVSNGTPDYRSTMRTPT